MPPAVRNVPTGARRRSAGDRRPGTEPQAHQLFGVCAWLALVERRGAVMVVIAILIVLLCMAVKKSSMLRDRRLGEWAHLTKRKIKHCKGSVILVNDARSATLSDKAERPEKKRQSAPGFAVKRAVIKSWRVFFWSNQPQKALTCFIIRFVSGPQQRCKPRLTVSRPRSGRFSTVLKDWIVSSTWN